MSRFTDKVGQNDIAFGFDHAFGYFFDVIEDVDGEDNFIIQESSLMTNMNHGKMLEFMNEYDVGSEEQRQKVALDLPF